MSSARSLNGLSPTEFENLIYDLMIARGMVNAVWRTPGADGGRDIEGESVRIDLSSNQSIDRWYVECKKYTGSVDWPTIYPKLSYADLAGASYLLLCTTSKFTTQAVNSCNSWNASNRRPAIRLWAGHDIENQLRSHPDLERKYGLEGQSTSPGGSIVALSVALSKTVGSHFASTVINGNPVDPMLRAAHSFALLLQYRMEEVQLHGAFSPKPITERVDIDASIIGSPGRLDEPSFLAFSNYLIALVKKRLTFSFDQDGVCTITGCPNVDVLLSRYRETFAAIAVWGNFDLTFNASEIQLRQRS